MRSYRRKWRALSLLWLCLVLIGCQKTDQVKEEESKEPIVVWTWDETFNVKAAKMAAEQYHNEHPDVEIVVETKEREEVLADIKNMLSAGVYKDIPDVVMIEDYDVQEMLSLYTDEFVELTDKLDYDRFVDYKKNLCERDGHYYGIPFDSGTAALFYRLDMIEKAGYSEADMEHLTWDEYIEIGKSVYRKTGIPMLTLDPTDFPVVRLIMQSNGKWYVKEDGCTADIQDNEALLQALQIYETLLSENIGMSVNGWNEFISSFQNGEVATVLSGVWIISSIKEAKDQEGLWRVTQIPVVSENENAVAASNVGGSSWYVLKNSLHSQDAIEFMVSMFGENDIFMNELISEIGIVPPVKDPTIFFNYEKEEVFFGGQRVTKILTDFMPLIPTINYGSKTYEIEDVLESEFQNTLSDHDVRKCLEKAQIKAEALARE